MSRQPRILPGTSADTFQSSNTVLAVQNAAFARQTATSPIIGICALRLRTHCQAEADLTPSPEFGFSKQLCDFYIECLGQVPKGQDRGVSVAGFQAANIGAIDTHPNGEFGLRQTRRQAAALQIHSDD